MRGGCSSQREEKDAIKVLGTGEQRCILGLRLTRAQVQSKPLVKAYKDAMPPQVEETDLSHKSSHSNCQVEQATRIKHSIWEGKSLWEK